MTKITVRLPGEWVDCWLYKEHLILWDEANRMYIAALSGVLRSIRSRYGRAAAALANCALFRNDWKNGSLLEEFLAIDGVLDAIASSVGDIPTVLEVDLGGVRAVESVRELPSGIVTDSVIYAGRIYIATTEALFETSLSLISPGQRRPTEAILDRPVYGVAAKYGAVNAAAHERGLWFRSIRFGKDAQEFDGRPLSLIGDVSLKIESFWRDLMNYEGGDYPSLLLAKAARERPHDAAQFEDWRVSGYEAPRQLRDDFEQVIGSSSLRYASPDRVLGNSDRQVLLAGDGVLIGARLSDRVSSLVDPRKSWRTNYPAVDRISETHPLLGGFVLEEPDRVSVCTQSGVATLFEGEVGRVRTFKDSLHYRQMVSVIHNDGVDLIGMFPGVEVDYEDQPGF